MVLVLIVVLIAEFVIIILAMNVLIISTWQTLQNVLMNVHLCILKMLLYAQNVHKIV